MDQIENKAVRWFESKIFRKELVAGGAAGLTANLSSYPLDTIDMRRKVHNENFSKALKNIFHSEGVTLIFFSHSFSSKDSIKGLCSYELGKKYFGTRAEDKLKIWQILVSGGVSGFFKAIASTPANYIKVKSQKDAGHPEKQTDSIKVATKTVHRKGIEGLYKGFSVAALRDIPGCAVLFATYEYLRRKLDSMGMNKNAVALFAGGCSTIVSQVFGMPQDSVLTDVQLTERPKRPIYELIKFLRKGGMESDLKGLPLSLGRSGLLGGLTFFVYEFSKGLLNVE